MTSHPAKMTSHVAAKKYVKTRGPGTHVLRVLTTNDQNQLNATVSSLHKARRHLANNGLTQIGIAPTLANCWQRKACNQRAIIGFNSMRNTPDELLPTDHYLSRPGEYDIWRIHFCLLDR